MLRHAGGTQHHAAAGTPGAALRGSWTQADQSGFLGLDLGFGSISRRLLHADRRPLRTGSHWMSRVQNHLGLVFFVLDGRGRSVFGVGAATPPEMR